MNQLSFSISVVFAASCFASAAYSQVAPMMSDEMQVQRQKALAHAMRIRPANAAREPQPIVSPGGSQGCEVNIGSPAPTTGGIRARGVHQYTQIIVIDKPPVIICGAR